MTLCEVVESCVSTKYVCFKTANTLKLALERFSRYCSLQKLSLNRRVQKKFICCFNFCVEF